jgi:hypothetical protein
MTLWTDNPKENEMKTMRSSIGPIGPLASMLIRQPGMDKPLQLCGLIDTGAAQTFTHHGTLANKGFASSGGCEIQTSEGLGHGTRFEVQAAFLSSNPREEPDWFDLSICENGVARLGTNLAIGRSALEHVKLIYDGKNGTFILEW